MSYTILRFEEDKPDLLRPGVRIFVAVIECSRYPEHPFRVTIEKFDSPEEARAEVDAWIKEREREDEAREQEEQKTAESQKQDATLEALNKSI